MNKIFCFLLLVVLAMRVSAQSSPQEKKVIDLSKRKFDWLIQKQYDSLNAILDDHLMYIHSNGWIQNKKEVVDDLKSGKLNYVKIAVKEVSARIYDKTAVVNGIATIDGVMEGKASSFELRYTEVYIQRGKNWILVSRHANKMP